MRSVAAIVVPAGFNGLFGRALTVPYDTYVSLSDYLMPGCVGLVLLLTAVPLMATLLRDRDNNSIQLLLVAPLPGWFLVFGRLSRRGASRHDSGCGIHSHRPSYRQRDRVSPAGCWRCRRR